MDKIPDWRPNIWPIQVKIAQLVEQEADGEARFAWLVSSFTNQDQVMYRVTLPASPSRQSNLACLVQVTHYKTKPGYRRVRIVGTKARIFTPQEQRELLKGLRLASHQDPKTRPNFSTQPAPVKALDLGWWQKFKRWLPWTR